MILIDRPCTVVHKTKKHKLMKHKLTKTQWVKGCPSNSVIVTVESSLTVFGLPVYWNTTQYRGYQRTWRTYPTGAEISKSLAQALFDFYVSMAVAYPPANQPAYPDFKIKMPTGIAAARG